MKLQTGIDVVGSVGSDVACERVEHPVKQHQLNKSPTTNDEDWLNQYLKRISSGSKQRVRQLHEVMKKPPDYSTNILRDVTQVRKSCKHSNAHQIVVHDGRHCVQTVQSSDNQTNGDSSLSFGRLLAR